MSAVERIALRARYVFPVDGTPIADGIVRIRGDRIEALGSANQFSADLDLGNVALLPGFANPHTHLDLSDALGRCPPSSDFVGWLRKVVAHRRGQTPEDVDRAVAAGIEHLVRSGTTMVGDISADGASWDRLAAAPLRSVVYHEILGLSRERGMASLQRASDWYRAHAGASQTCRPGFSPHAPYSVHRDVFRQMSDRSLGEAPPAIATHFQESREELELIERRTGPFVDFLKDMGAWEPASLIEDWSEILAMPAAFVHGNYVDAAAPFPHPLIYCPRTHAAFGHSPHPFRRMRTRGFALGTDSLASNPDLSVFEEARFLLRRYPDYDQACLLRLITFEGAAILGWASDAGTLAPGKSADLVVLPLPNRDESDPHRLIFASDLAPTQTMFRGQWVAHQEPRTK